MLTVPSFQNSPNYNLLRDAVANRTPVSLFYKGHTREVCVHTIGWKQNKEKVLTYQFGGGSSSGLPQGGEWRCMFVADIDSISTLEADWHTDPRHSRPQTCVDVVDIETS